MVPYGLLQLWEGELEKAVAWFEHGVQRMAGGAPDWTAARCLPGYVEALRRLGRVREAAEWAARAVTVERDFGGKYELTGVLDQQAWLLHGNDPQQARDLHLEALQIRRDHRLRTGYADSMDAVADLEATAGNHAEAARLLGVSDAAREEMEYPRPPVQAPDHEALLDSLRSAMGSESFDDAWQDGWTRSIDDMAAALTRGRGRRNRPATGWRA